MISVEDYFKINKHVLLGAIFVYKGKFLSKERILHYILYKDLGENLNLLSLELASHWTFINLKIEDSRTNFVKEDIDSLIGDNINNFYILENYEIIEKKVPKISRFDMMDLE